MEAIWMRVRAEFRAGWRGMVVLAVLLGLGGGVALTAFAGARRADAAMPQFLAYTQPTDGVVVFGNLNGPAPPVTGPNANSLALLPEQRRVMDLPQVAAWSRSPYLFLSPSRKSDAGTLNTFGVASPDLARTVDRPYVVAGHVTDADLKNPAAAIVNELAAQKFHLHVGSHLRLYALSIPQVRQLFINGSFGGARRLEGPAFTVHVAAIVRFPVDVNAIVPLAAKQHVTYEGQQNMYLTQAFVQLLASRLHVPVQNLPAPMNVFGVRLRHGAADWKAFAAAAQRVGGGTVFVQAGDYTNNRVAAATAQRGIRLEVVALIAFGTLAALVTLLLVGQALARQVTLEDEDYATFRSLGATRRQILGVALLRAGVVGVAGAVLAVVIAVVASPLMPIGLARRAEIHPGISVDWFVLAIGALAIVVLVVARTVVPGWRASKSTTASAVNDDLRPRPSRVAGALARAAAPPAVIGVRFGLERGRGRSSVPVAIAIVGAVAALTVLAAALSFGASLSHMVNTPRQQGWNWDVIVGNPNYPTDREAAFGSILARNRDVGAYSAVANLGSVAIGGVQVPNVIAIDPMKGSVFPPLLQGRAPVAPDEIVLATHTLQLLHRRVGQSTQIRTPAGPVTMHIVGRMLMPSVGDILTNGVGDGGWVSGSLVHQLARQASGNPNAPQPPPFVLFPVRYAPGVPRAAAFDSLERSFSGTVLRPLAGADAANLQSVDRLPLVLAGLVALLGVATVGNALMASVRRRRKDLAILKTVGFVRRQVRATVAWQATSFAVVAMLVGLPLGIAAGRWTWNAVASSIYAVSPPIVPVLPIALVVLASFVVANLIAGVPAWRAARTAPAVVLRAE